MERIAQEAKAQKQKLEQVAQEKSSELATLQSKLEAMEASQETTENEPEQPKPPIIIFGDSNCRDIQAHLMIWTNQPVTKQWAPTIREARDWAQNNADNLEGTTVVFLCGTNDLKNGKTRQEVCAQHKEVAQILTSAGANLIVTQLPPVYRPQIRAEQRNRDTEIINEILLERYNGAVA